MANAVQLTVTPGTGIYSVDVSSADKDLTDPAGITGGYSARKWYITGAGNFKFKGLDGNAVTLDIAAKTFVDVPGQYVYQTGTTATGIFAIL